MAKIILETSPGERRICTVAEARYHALKEMNIPDIGLQNFKLTGLKAGFRVSRRHGVQGFKMFLKPNETLQDGENEIFMRSELEPEQNSWIVYNPADLTDDQIAEGILKRDVAGAAFIGNFHRITELNNVKILWRCTLQSQPPALVKPSKPKLVLICSTHLEPGFFYKIT